MIRGQEVLVVPRIDPQLMQLIDEAYEHWFWTDSIANPVTVMKLLGQAAEKLRQNEIRISELEAEVQRLSIIAKY